MNNQTRLNIAAAVGLMGFVCALLLVLFGDTHDLRHVWGNEVAVVLLAGPSAWCGGLAVAGLLGHDGPSGWLFSMLGFAVATVLGAMIAGTLLAPVIGTLLAPTILFINFVETPLLGFGWIATVAASHYIAIKLRA